MSREIVSGIAITTLIFAAAVYMPVIGFFCALFLPLPVLYFRTRLGRGGGAVIALATLFVMLAAIGRVSVDVVVFAELMLLGFFMAEMYEREATPEAAVLGAASVVLLSALLCLALYSSAAGTGIAALISGYVARNLELTLALYRNMGVSEESIRMIADSMEHIQYVLVRVIPAFSVVSVLFVAWTTLLLSRPVLRSRGLDGPGFGSLNRWRAPEQLVWAVIGCGVILLLASGGTRIIGLNGLLILTIVYFFQGIAVTAFFFEKKGFPRAVRVFLYSLIALQQVILLVVIALGFFDTWFNFRKLDAPGKP